jgi:hypothetical protein
VSDADRLLGIYLNDHRAAAVGTLELARRSAGANRSNRYGVFLAELAGELEADLHALEELMERLQLGRDRLKQLAGWTAEKFGRFKLNGRWLDYSPLSLVVELEVLSLGVDGKLSLWRGLQKLADQDPRLDADELAGLAARARSQRQRLERRRLQAARAAFREAPGSAS